MTLESVVAATSTAVASAAGARRVDGDRYLH